MDRFKERYGKWALIAGAAEGIGEGFSIQLARVGMNIVMVDNNLEAMRRLADRIIGEMQVEVRQIHLDLSFQEASGFVFQATEDLDCRLLIYVSAYSKVKPFLSSSPAELDSYLMLNNRTPIHLVYGFAGRLQAKERSGGIILISSLAGLLGPPLVAPYAATKGFLIRLAESLAAEFKPLSIDITVCCAGLTSTPTFLENTPEKTRNKVKPMDPEKVAEYAVRHLGRKAVCIPGWRNRMSFFLLLRLLPRALSLKIMGKTMKKMYLVVR
ncbi:MAG: SDR family NAD(P)-dependent oxidoreductase [Bacteroidales bacterium]|nr:SDR family NAD(P)-dependent oxidoreductase [Bacteroidales bacterium]